MGGTREKKKAGRNGLDRIRNSDSVKKRSPQIGKDRKIGKERSEETTRSTRNDFINEGENKEKGYTAVRFESGIRLGYLGGDLHCVKKNRRFRDRPARP